MKTDQQLRLECVKLANVLASAKVIPAKDVLAKAEELYQWVIKIDNQ